MTISGIIRFSLRSLLVSVVLIALLCSWIATKMATYRKQHVVVQELQAYFQTRDVLEAPDIEKTAPATERWLRHFVGDDRFYTIDAIRYTGGSDLAGSSLKYVAQLPRVNTLDLFLTGITDKDLAPLADSDIMLQELDLSCTDITDAGMVYVCRVRSLQTLAIDGTLVSDDGLKGLRQLAQLESLSAGCDLTDEGMRHIARVRNLRNLAICGECITSVGLRSLQRLPHLESLDLREVRVVDGGIEVLEGMPNLKYLSFNGARCTLAALEGLVRARPDIQMHIRGRHGPTSLTESEGKPN